MRQEDFDDPTLISSKVAVIVTTYNHSQFVRSTLDSVLSQSTDFDFQVVVYDDYSTDGTQEILKDFKSKFPSQVLLMLSQENQFSLGRDTTIVALQKINSKYIAFCEGDDIWLSKDKLQRQFNFMEENESWCSISHHDVDLIESNGGDWITRHLHREFWVRDRRVRGRNLINGNFIYTCSVMIRRAALRNDFLSKINGRQPGDYLIFSQACEQGDIGYLKGVSSGYRIHSANMWAGSDDDSRNQLTLEAREFLASNLLPPLSQEFREFIRTGLRIKDKMHVRIMRFFRFRVFQLVHLFLGRIEK